MNHFFAAKPHLIVSKAGHLGERKTKIQNHHEEWVVPAPSGAEYQ